MWFHSLLGFQSKMEKIWDMIAKSSTDYMAQCKTNQAQQWHLLQTLQYMFSLQSVAI